MLEAFEYVSTDALISLSTAFKSEFRNLDTGKPCSGLVALPSGMKSPISFITSMPAIPTTPTIFSGNTIYEYKSLTNRWEQSQISSTWTGCAE